MESTHVENTLTRINEFVTIKNQWQTLDNYNCIRDDILKKMCNQDEFFKRINKGSCLAGSYADNLKVTAPDEFDLLIIFKLPFPEHVDIVSDKEKPGNVKINIKQVLKQCEMNIKNYSVIYNGLQNLVDDNCFLLIQKFQSWFQRVLAKIRDKPILYADQTYQITYKTSGPAHTSYVKANPVEFSIDLVPALRFSTDHWCALKPCPDNIFVWEAIPKPYNDGNSKCISWRGSYADTERKIINDKKNLKYTLRQLKKFRDKHNFSNFKSYYIKTMYLLECDKNESQFWNKPASFLIVYMMGQWIEYLKKGYLPFYWDNHCNLLELKNEHFVTRAAWLQGVLDDLRKAIHLSDANKIYNIFLTKEEIDSMTNNNTTTTESEVSSHVNQSIGSETPIQAINDESDTAGIIERILRFFF